MQDAACLAAELAAITDTNATIINGADIATDAIDTVHAAIIAPGARHKFYAKWWARCMARLALANPDTIEFEAA